MENEKISPQGESEKINSGEKEAPIGAKSYAEEYLEALDMSKFSEYEQAILKSDVNVDYLNGIHTTRDGQKIALKDMSLAHLVNSCRLFRENWRSEYIVKELMDRGYDPKTIWMMDDMEHVYDIDFIKEQMQGILYRLDEKTELTDGLIHINEIRDLFNDKIDALNGKNTAGEGN